MRPLIRLIPPALLLLAPALSAQVEIERRRPAPARGEISIRNDFGAIVVRAWEKNEVLVRGTLAAGAEELSFDGDKTGADISVAVPESWFHAPGEDAAFRTTLEITVPAASRLSIESVNASVDVAGVAGEIDVTTVNGGVKIDGPTKGVEVETMTGAVEVRANGAPMRVHTVSGKVSVAGASGEIGVETVSGPVEVAGSAVAQLEIQTTTGAVGFSGTIARTGSIRIETFSSPVRLVLPRGVHTEFDLTSFSGKIQSDFCAGTPVTRERFEPYRQLRCSTGLEGFEIGVRTHDADITIAAEGGDKGVQP